MSNVMTTPRPKVVKWALAPNFPTKDQGWPQLQTHAEGDGFTIVHRDLGAQQRVVYLQQASKKEIWLLHRIADLLKADVWDIWAEFLWVHDGGRQRLDQVVFRRLKVPGLTPEKRESTLWPVIDTLPDGNDGWTIADDQKTGQVVLRYGAPLSLPDAFSGRDTLPKCYDPSQWARIPEGINARGRLSTFDLATVPHRLIAGGTGSGKSTELRNDIVARLLRGHSIVIIDTVKEAVDFLTLKPWTLMWSESITEAANVLATLYEEAKRRRAVNKRFKVGSWTKVPQEVREREDYGPISLYYDEYENSIVPTSVPKGLPDDHPFVIEARSINAAVEFVQYYMPKLAKEARSVGIFLNVATQTPLANAIGSPLRGNLGASTQLSGGKLESHVVKLAMGEATERAMEQFRKFNKPKLDGNGEEMEDEYGSLIMMPGLAVTNRVGGEPIALRVAYVPEEEAPQILEEYGVPLTKPWKILPALPLQMVPTEHDEEDDRPRIDPPFKAFTHLGQVEGLFVDEETQSSDESSPATSDAPSQPRKKTTAERLAERFAARENDES
ncbi:FtsK/SpoIIIE domain-containing protein [Leifsonia xyli]|uniref:FtsK/SpoIIIE domain-containing protein n=1 Tax=Leifsonia xyli TaxID=1575 RepID=UPI003D66EE6C